MRFDELRAHIATLEKLGLDVTKLRVQLHRKIWPSRWSALVMTLIGIPFAFVVARRGALYGIARQHRASPSCTGPASRSSSALGNNALLPPLLAAWAPEHPVRRGRAVLDAHAGDVRGA